MNNRGNKQAILSKKTKRQNRNRNIVFRGIRNENILETSSISHSDISPPMITRIMNYVDDSMTRSVAAAWLSFRFRANSVFDPDPLILTGGIAGFSELAQLYDFYRVTHLEFEWSVSNLEAFPVMVGAVFSNRDINSLISSTTAAHNALENGFTSKALIMSGAGGQDRLLVRGKLALSKLWGDEISYWADQDFASVVTTNPAKSLYINFIVTSGTGANLSNGISSSLKLRYTTEWFARATNLS